MPQLSFDWVTPTGIPLTISFACQASIYVSELFRSIRARAKVEGMRAGLVHQLLLGQDVCLVSGWQASLPTTAAAAAAFASGDCRLAETSPLLTGYKKLLLLLMMMMMATATAEDAGCKSKAVVYFFSAS